MLMNKKNPQAKVGVSMKMDKLIELMEMGVICGADLHTSDPATKDFVQQACLKSCLQKVCYECDMSDDCSVSIKPCQSTSQRVAMKEVVLNL